MVNPIGTGVSRVLGGITKSTPYNWATKNVNRKTMESAIAYTTIGSIGLKDFVGCCMYVYQSVHNDKIPEERRKVNDKLFHKLFKSFDKEGKVMGQNIRRYRAEQKLAGEKIDDKAKLRDSYLGMKDVAYSLFKSVTELVAATILAKRIIVPFIATPLASKVEKYMGKDSKASADKNKADDKSNPSMQGKLDIISSEAMTTPPIEESTNLLDKYRK